MAVMKKKGERSVPAMATTSLPDVVYIVLFFFMLSTTMREEEVFVSYTVPQATEIQKLEKKGLVSIHIGQPSSRELRSKYGDAPRIQLNDSYKTAQDIGQFVAAARDDMKEEDRAAMVVALKADEEVKMGMITDVKKELRRAEAFKISYVSKEKKTEK
jgi:biopolymer transport protein ExbD